MCTKGPFLTNNPPTFTPAAAEALNNQFRRPVRQFGYPDLRAQFPNSRRTSSSFLGCHLKYQD